MIATLLLGLAASGALVTWAFLRPRGRATATPFPSLQHLRGEAAPRRRTFSIEDRVDWLLRLAALLFFAFGIASDFFGLGAGALQPVVLVDPATGSQGWELAQKTKAAAWLSFDGEQVRAAGPLGAWLAPAAAECSASFQRCLARAAVQSGRPIILIGESKLGWEGLGAPGEAGTSDEPEPRPALALAKPTWVEAPRQLVGDSPLLAPAPRPTTRVRRLGQSPEAWLWAAALEEAAQTIDGPPELEVRDAATATGGLPVLLVASTAGPASGWLPEVAAKPVVALGLDAPIAGVAGLVVNASLQFGSSRASRSLAGSVVIAKEGPGVPAVAAVATAAELARWAHEGQLTNLARLVLAALSPSPVRSTEVPPPDAWRVLQGWTSADANGLNQSGVLDPAINPASSRPSALGVLDVAPGTYLRGDGRVRVELARAQGSSPGPLQPSPLPRSTVPWPTALLAVAALCFAVALLRARRLASTLVGLLVLSLLGAGLIDLDLAVERVTHRLVRLEPAAPVLGAALRDAGLDVVTGAASPDCLKPRHAAPCLLVATLGTAAAPATDGLVFDPTAPRVDVLSVRAPSSVSLGAAAKLEVTLGARRAAHLLVTATPAHGAPVEREVELSSDDAVLGVDLAVVPLLAGLEQVVVEARVTEAHPPKARVAAAQRADDRDAQLTWLRVENRKRRRVVLAGAPSWEARFARQALRHGPEGELAGLTRIGATAVQAVDLPRVEPLRWLSTPGALEEVDTVLLTGFQAAELAGAPAKALTAFLERGGGLLFLGAAGAEALGWPGVDAADGPPVPLRGELNDGSRPVDLTLAAPGPVPGPLGAERVAELEAPDGGQRAAWVLGRAQGLGRMAVVRTADLFRLSPPAGEAGLAERVLFRALGWVEAAPPSSSQPETTGAPSLESLPPRARLRSTARLDRRPFLELEGPDEAARVFASLPPEQPRPLPVPVRREPRFAAVTFGALALEALTRRLRRRT